MFEIAKTAGGYASAPTMLVSFTGADGEHPYGGLLVDAAGDLFGTTISGGANDEGTVFEIAKSEGGYAGAPTTLVNFTGADGSAPYGALIADAAGDLFGTTAYGGIDNQGTVFEIAKIAKTDGGDAGAPATIVKFTGADGAYPLDSLILDAAGDLFGTTVGGGTRNHGVVFEIAKTDGGYAGAPTTLVLLKTAHGLYPLGGLIADAAGNLFGTALDGGVDNNGAVFEIRHGGFVPPAAPLQSANKPSPLGAAFVQAMAGHGQRGFVGNSLAIFASQHEARTLLAPPNIA